MLSRVLRPRFSLSYGNRVSILQIFSSSTTTPAVARTTCELFIKKSMEHSHNLSKLYPVRNFCSTDIDPFEEIEIEEQQRLEESDDDGDDSDGTIYLDVEDVQKKRLVVPVVGLCLPLIVTDVKPLFPRFSKIIVLNNPKLIELVRGKVILQQPFVGVFLRRNGDSVVEVVDSLDEVYDVGTIATIKTMQDFGNCLRLVVKAQQRVKLKGATDLSLEQQVIENKFKSGRRVRLSQQGRIRFNQMKSEKFHERILDSQTHTGEILLVKVEQIKTDRIKLTKELKALKSRILDAIKETSTVSYAHKRLIDTALSRTNLMNIMSYLSDFGASISGAEPEELQEVMDEINVPKRMSQSLNLLKRQLTVHKLQMQIAQRVEKNVVKDHRKVILEEKLKEVIDELGTASEDSSVVAKRFEQRLKSKCVPKNVRAVIDDELMRLRYLDNRSEAYCSTRNYLDWLTVLPWGLVSAENLNLEQAAKVLDEDHYGMQQIKRRILEFIAASQLRGDSKGGILCIYGPPGVGKTSVASSMARALNREFFNFCVGGLNDVAEIKGHRRTYLGAMPGKLIQCLKKTKTENPLILLDEIDKIGTDRIGGGEATSAMLELLDPEQNKTFLDHFMDVPVDLSRVFFVCTANDPHKIPHPLRDRMELLPVAGFTDAEKQNIAKKYLLPKIMRECGLKEHQFSMSDDALAAIISGYCRESGVRKLQQKIEKIIRKVALKLVKDEVITYDVTSDNLEAFIGKPPYRTDRFYRQTPAGVVMSLVCSPLGGMALYIETTKRKLNQTAADLHNEEQNCELCLTGNLGTVMEESAQIALTVARNFVADRFGTNDFLETQELHLNVPTGSVHKDGASAGVSISTALVSLAIDRAVPQNIALTGEISLTGKVLRTQDIKEKVIAAKRSGISCLILPKDNLRDYTELPAYITQGLEVHFVDCFEEVYKTLFKT